MVLRYPALQQIEQGPDGLPECVTGQGAILGYQAEYEEKTKGR